MGLLLLGVAKPLMVFLLLMPFKARAIPMASSSNAKDPLLQMVARTN